MKNPQMHCTNPNCVDDNCHGECREQNENFKDCCGSSGGCDRETGEETVYCEDS